MIGDTDPKPGTEPVPKRTPPLVVQEPARPPPAHVVVDTTGPLWEPSRSGAWEQGSGSGRSPGRQGW
jgi:hypothetical protein